jgi:hypothetical protein
MGHPEAVVDFVFDEMKVTKNVAANGDWGK